MDKNLEDCDCYLLKQLFDNVDVGMIILNRDLNIHYWNVFMQAYSGISSETAEGRLLFDVMSGLPENWLKNKIDSTLKLRMRSFSSWEDRPWIFKFSNFNPISGGFDVMYQNMTLIPLQSSEGQYTHVCMIIRDVTDVAKNKTHLRDSNEELTHLSITDQLTQLHNRGHWEECLADEFEKCRQLKVPSTLVLFDIDYFKKVNDNYGHLVGDIVLKNISKILVSTKRQSDIAGRYGGEEFGIILRGTNAEMAKCFSERFRKRIEAATTIEGKIAIKTTISLGICEWSPELKSYEAWLKQTDYALYHSKKKGRNTSTVIGQHHFS